MDKSLFSSLITWLRTFPDHADLTASSLTDGVTLGTILHQIAPEYFSEQWLAKIKIDVSDNWRLKVSNLRKIHQGVMDYFYSSELPGQSIHQFPTPDLNKIVEHEDEIEMGRLLQLILGCAINCEQKQKHIEAIMGMEEGVQTLIVNAIQDLMNRESSPGLSDVSGGSSLSGAWLGPASFHPQMKTLLEQLESTSLAKEDMTRRCNELDLAITVLNEEKKKFKEENEKLLERIEVLESGGDIGTQSSRYKDLRKQVDALQDELYKVESARDEYRSRVDRLEKENKEVTSRSEELQRLADEARALKDEVDALRDMSERVAVYEGTVETYKKKLEELSDLKRQVKILEEKNSDYMQQNMELEEEVKKSGTWRPQLDLYKKQVSELHQKLAEETKKTDRQVFENKKIVEKLEALTQEKERLALERDMLKENVEELKCTVSALSSPDTASRPPSDLSDIDTLEIIPPEIREKLVRLQHENRVLKQKANDKSEESAPVLQSLLNDLQERHNKLLQENRWEKPSPPSPSSYHSQWPPFGRMWPLEAYFMLDSQKKSQRLKVLKRNLKWASESDLLILRQPSHTNFMASLLSSNGHSAKRRNSSPHNRSLTLPTNATAPASSHPNKENPIVIHHIHEFKMAPSPTNEDSGCCRTSPSSCEGCEDHRSSGSCGIRTPDYGNTLDSGVSGMFRCLSPVIPSIVEECTTHHMSDILPAILNQEGNAIPPVLYHTHPTHSTSNHARTNPHHASAICCCSLSPKSPYDIASDGTHSKPSSPHQNTCTPFTTLSHSLSSHVTSDSNDLVGGSVTAEQPALVRSQSTRFDPPNQDLCGPLQSRKQNSLPQRPEPSDSPTPHNSPRLPHSIHSNRNKGGKVPTSVVVLTRGNSGTHGMPKVQNSNITSSENDKESSPAGSICERRGERKEMSRLRSETPTLKFLRDSSSQTSDQPEVQSDKPAKPYLETNLDNILSSRFRPRSRETLNRITGKLRSGIMNKVRSKSLDKYRPSVENVLRIHSTPIPYGSPKRSTSLLTQKDPKVEETGELIVTGLSDPKPENRIERLRHLGRSSGLSDKQDVYPNKGEPSSQRKSWGFENSPLYKSLKEGKLLPLPSSAPVECRKKNHGEKSWQRYAPGTSRVAGRPENINQTPRGENSYNSALHPLHKSQSENLLKGRKRNRTPGSTKSLKNSLTSSANDVGYSKSPSSRESLSSWHNLPSSSIKRAEKKSPEVTLLTDTLFTHFVVTPKKNPAPSPPRGRSESTPSIPSIRSLPVPLLCPSSSRVSKASEPLLSDTDTDIELVENRLVSSAYAAPLVSSESFTSILQSDNNTDFDPSATDYCTEPETDFNPRQYKLLNTLDEKRKVIFHREDLQKADMPDTDALIVASPHVVIRSNSYFKKKKKQVIMASKGKILSGGIMKVKNKTARAVVAETFNAMFTFCTP